MTYFKRHVITVSLYDNSHDLLFFLDWTFETIELTKFKVRFIFFEIRTTLYD